MVRYSTRAFLLGTFALSWSIWLGLVLGAREGLLPTESVGSLYGLGVLAPSAVAFALAIWSGGMPAGRELASRGVLWRVPGRWYAYAILLPVTLRVSGLVLYHLAGGTLLPNPIHLSQVVVAAILGLLVGAMEEFGWRGYLQPALGPRHSSLGTGLRVGGVWAAWHAPLFWMPGTGFYRWALITGRPSALIGYLLAVVALGLLISVQFVSTRGSVWMAILFHSAVNTSSDALFAPYARIGELGPLKWSVAVLVGAGVAAAWALHRRDADLGPPVREGSFH